MYYVNVIGSGLHLLKNLDTLEMHYTGLQDEYMDDLLTLNLKYLGIYKCTITHTKRKELKDKLGDIFHTD